MRVECIDDSNKPADIPLSKWLVKGSVYNVIDMQRLTMTGEYGYKLLEIDLTGCGLYRYFNVNRFKEVEEDDALVEVEKKELANV